MITQKDIIGKCGTLPGLRPLGTILSRREYSQEELEAIDFTIEIFISMQQSISHLTDILIAKLEIWLSSTKDTD